MNSWVNEIPIHRLRGMPPVATPGASRCIVAHLSKRPGLFGTWPKSVRKRAAP